MKCTRSVYLEIYRIINRYKFIEEEIAKKGPEAEQAVMMALKQLDLQNTQGNKKVIVKKKCSE